MWNLDFLLLSEDRLLKINREVVAKVITLLRSTTALPPTRSARATKSLEKRFEQVGKAAHVAHVRATGRSPKASFSKLVVSGPSLGVIQHLVGATDFLELVFGSRFLIDIRVVLTGHPPISTLQRIRISIATHSKQVVVIGHQASPTWGCSDAASELL